jgi:hypothetical protein
VKQEGKLALALLILPEEMKKLVQEPRHKTQILKYSFMKQK